MINLKINSSDLQRIQSKLAKIHSAAATHKWTFRAELLDQYGKTIARAMGSVDARGGYPEINFMDDKGLEYPEYRWPALSPWTVALKAPRRGHKWLSREQALKVFEKYADTVKIWVYTGRSKMSMEHPFVYGTFVGIENDYAKKVEEGGEGEFEGKKKKIPKRPLFAVVNELFALYLKRELAKPNSELSKKIKAEFYEFCTAEGWGSN